MPEPVDLFLDAGAGGLAGQLYQQLRDAIMAGRLQPGDQLPSSRQLARELGVSRHTVTTAYGSLVAEGFVCGRAGGGSVVAALPGPRPGTGSFPASIMPSRRFAGWLCEPGPLARPAARYDLRAGLPDSLMFPVGAWRRQLSAVMRAGGMSASGDAAGEPDLRMAIARWISRSRSVAADASTVVVTSGARHAIDLIGRLLLEPGDIVAVEDPGYLPVVLLLRSMGARVTGVPVDGEGVIVSELPAGARLAYLTPSHQYPLGVVMSLARRRELLAWAGENGAAVIEDDYDSEFRYADRPLEPIHRLDDSGRVIYVGSFSKTLSPALRLGFAVVPPSLAIPLAALRQVIDSHPPPLAQLALARLLNDGTFGKHIRRAGRVYAQRYQILRAALAGPLARWLTPVPAQAGLHITALLPAGCDEDRVRAAAVDRGVAVTGLQQYYCFRPRQPGLLLGFGAIAAGDLPAAVSALRDALASLAD
jgi:GntR family transcriptional regulator / MocR family aminotransferase